MKRVEVLSVGTELLMGQIANTNAQYISRRVPELGMGVYYHSVVGDNPQRLKESLAVAMSRADVIFTTGGLGPTQDDLTKDTVAEALGLPMELDDESAARIKEHFTNNGKTMPESNLRQAYFPKGSLILDNGAGTAPGCIVTQGDKIVIMLPGPPKELIPMFDRHVPKFFGSGDETPLCSKFLRVIGIGESLVEEKLMSLVDGQTNPTIATYAKDGVTTIRVTAHDEGGILAEMLVNDMSTRICEILGHSVYATQDEEIENTVFRLLKEKNLTFACAESCTGGMLAERITAIPGASQVLLCGAVTYSEESKVQMLGVSRETIEKYGVVSSETALEMVRGIMRNSGADVAVSITGYAGPKNGDEPVGKVYIGVAAPGVQYVREFDFVGTRERTRNLSVVYAFDMVRRALLHI